MRFLVAAAALVCLSFSGCVGDVGQGGAFGADNSITFGRQGQFEGDVEEKTIQCDSDGHWTVGGQGQGDLEITVTDGAGQQIGNFEIHGQSQQGEDQDLRGQNGTWTLKITTGYDDPPLPQVMDPQPHQFQGQYGGTLSC